MYEIKTHSALECSIVKTLAYFDLFNYPLTKEEIHNFLQHSDIETPVLGECIFELVKSKCIFQFENLYSLQNDSALAQARYLANKEASRFLPIARDKAKMIFRFPFVRSVMASGSLSKNCMDENSDLDFFIITAPRRVWIVRLMLTIYKKILLRNSHKLFCVNYYLDEEHLKLSDENIFTATELATLIPLEGFSVFEDLQQKNQHWVKSYFPNSRMLTGFRNHDRFKIKNGIEKMLAILPLGRLEHSIMVLTHRRWKKMYAKSMSEKDFNTAFKSEIHVSKAHPRNFQKKIIEQYRSNLLKYSRTLEMPLL